MVTETDRNKARSAVVSAYNALDCVTIPFSFLHAFADAAVDAVSADAEPVAWVDPQSLLATPHNLDAGTKTDQRTKSLYAEPVKTAPAVAVKERQMINNMLLSQVLQNAFFAGRGTSGIVSRDDMAAWQDYDPYHLEAFKRIRSALSAQVQDVAVPEAKPEKKVEPDRSKFPYVWEGPKPDEAIIHQVINAYMGAQEREYDIDQFRYYKANWHWHYTINQHMKAAVDAASPASKHGDAE